MNRESIQEFVTSAQSDIDKSPQMGEATTKAAILRDFIELLGWQIPANTELEYPVDALGRTFNVDYALVIEGRPVAFLEAKGLDTSLTAKHREQLSEYLRSKDVNWGILTNGEEYEFYQRRVIDSKVTVEAVEKTELSHLPQRSQILKAYQIETIRKEESRQIIQHIRDLREALEKLNERKDKLTTEVVDVLTDSLTDAVESEAETEAKEMIDRLAAEIQSDVDPSIPDPTQEVEPRKKTEESAEDQDIYRAELHDGGVRIESFQDTVQSDLMTNVTEYLIRDHGLVSEIKPLPYIPGKKRAIINDEPEYDGTEMAQWRELSGGNYVELNLSWDQKKREMSRMAAACGLELEVTADRA